MFAQYLPAPSTGHNTVLYLVFSSVENGKLQTLYDMTFPTSQTPSKPVQVSHQTMVTSLVEEPTKTQCITSQYRFSDPN